METNGLGTIASNGRYYSPKYWVMKWIDKDDVVIETASKNLLDSKEKAFKIYSDLELEDKSKYEFITIEIARVLTLN